MKEITTVLLDVDGTLLDFKKAQENALILAFKKHGIELNDDVRTLYNKINHDLWKQYELGKISRDTVLYTRFCKLFEALGLDKDGVAFEKDYQALLSEGAFLIDGAMQIVTYLNDYYDLYIVTNGVATTQYKRLKAAGLDRYMKGIFISEELGFQKPDINFFNKCFEQIGNIDLDKTIIIGDTLTSDILGGNNANIMTCWYNPEREKNDTNAVVDIEITELAQLAEFL